MKAAYLLLFAASGCVWTQFDQLRDDVWVDSVEAIEGSTRYGEVVMEATSGPTSGGTTVAVIGRNTASVSGLVYTDDGTRSTHVVPIGDVIPLITQFDDHPVYAADPGSDQVAFAALTGSAGDQTNRGMKVGVFHGADLTATVPGGTPYEPTDVAVPMLATDVPPTAMGFGTTTEAMIGRRDQLLHVSFSGSPGTWGGCALPTAGETAYAIGYGDVDGAAGNEWIIASAPVGLDAAPDPGRIWIFPAGSEPTDITGATPCPAPTKEVTSGTAGTDFPFGAGTQIVVADLGAGPRVLVSSPGTGGKLTVVDFTQVTPAFTQIIGTTVADIDSFVVADVVPTNPGNEIVVGAPGADDAGATGAGAVRILKIDGSPAVEDYILFDANPKKDQKFGKSVAVVPYGSHNILVVGAEGEVFTYFRTTFYDEVRAGRAQ